MAIQKVSAYRVGERLLPTIEEAQRQELMDLIKAGETPTDIETHISDFIVNNADEVVAILTCQPKSKAPRKPRSDIGKKRAPKTETPAMV